MKKKTKKKLPVTKSRSAKTVKKTSPRNSPVPKAAISVVSVAPPQVTHEMIAKRAYEIFLGGQGGDEIHNWLTAERQLRG